MQLIHGDCLEKMRDIPDQSVDMVLTDPPYGTTACKWDSVIPFEPMWEQLKRIIKPKGAIVLFGREPFSSALRMSNIKNYKYDWVWNKKQSGSFQNAKFVPLQINENISVFHAKNYYPIMRQGVMRNKGGEKNHFTTNIQSTPKSRNNYYYPVNILDMAQKRMGNVHPTQKPVALLEYLIKTYTLECETVLDFTMGSGSTGVACLNLNRDFIGIEKDEKYFQISVDRIAQAQKDKAAMLDL